MALVALGLVLICWRMFAGKSARWLINTNAIAAALVLITCSVIDLNAISAAWNVRHAREAGGRAAPLDLCQLRRMGPPALLSLIDLESRPLEPVFRDRVRAVRQDILDGRDWGAGLISRQADWHSWTWRDARRLADATRRLGAHPAQPLPNRNGRDCDGSIFRPLPPTPLTPAAKP
jgi:hypothetical protein